MASEKVSIEYVLKENVSKGLASLSKSLKDIGKKLLSPVAILGALTVAAGFMIKSFAKIETKMRNVGNLTLASSKEVAKMTDELLTLGKTVPASIDDLATSLFDVVSAGVPAAEAVEFLGVAAKLASAGVTTTGVAVDGLTSTMNAYSIEASEAMTVSDKFFGAQQAGKTTIAELSNNIGKVAPLANAMGVSLDDLLSSVSALTLQGIKTSEATTGLRAALSAVSGPATDAKKVARELGLTFNATALESQGLEGFLREVIEATGGNVGAMKKLFGSVEAVNAVVALSNNNFKGLSDVSDKVANSLGVTTLAADNQAKTLAGAWAMSMNRMTSFGNFLVSKLQPLLLATIETVNFMYDSIASIGKIFTWVANLGKSSAEKISSASEESAGKQAVAEEVVRQARLKTKSDQIQNLMDLKDAEADAIKEILATHGAKVAELEAMGNYQLETEIAMLAAVLEAQTLSEDNRVKISTMRLKLVGQLNKKTTDKIIKEEEMKVARLKALGQLSLEEENLRLVALMENTQLNTDQREALATKLFNLETQQMLEKNANQEFLFSEEQRRMQEIEKMKKKGVTFEMQMQKIILDSAREAGNQHLSLEKQIANGVLDIVKKQIIAAVDMKAAEYAARGVALLTSSFGLNPKGYANLAAAAGLSAGIRSGLSGIKLAEGGIVMPTPGGTQATIGEAGQAEAVIPLGSKSADNILGGGGGGETRVIILAPDGVTTLTKGIMREKRALERTGQIGSGLI